MEFLNDRTKNYLRRKLKLLAIKEVDTVLKVVKHHYPQLKNLGIAYDDVPDLELLKTGIKIEAEYYFNADKNELTLFLFNIYLAVENDSGDFRRRIRNAILTVAGDLTGEDMRE